MKVRQIPFYKRSSQGEKVCIALDESESSGVLRYLGDITGT